MANFPASRTFAAILMTGLVSVCVAGQQPLFKSGTERVTVAVVARDHHGKPLKGLSAADFEVLADGEKREILDFRDGSGDVSVALLLDASGSMRIAPKLQQAIEVGRMLTATLSEGVDEVGLYVFDTKVRAVHPFTTDFQPLRSAMESIHPYGSTSLYDAVAEVATDLSMRPGRRALVVLTDGVDTSSRLTAKEVSAIASGIDMPVYIVAVGASTTDLSTNLSDLARWSGGALLPVRSPADSSLATRQIVTDLRHQYVLAFEPYPAPGWHSIEVRGARRATLQARSGYWINR